MEPLGYVIAGLLGPFVRLIIYTPILWLVRKVAPSWERILFGKMF